MGFTLKPPMLTGNQQADMRNMRDYLFQLAGSLDGAVTAPAAVSFPSAAAARSGKTGTGTAGTGTAEDALKAVQKNADELRALIIKTADEIQVEIDNIELTTFYVKYADAFTGEYPDEMYNAPTASTEYMGVCSSSSATAPTAPSAYTWSKIKGNRGEQGSGVTVASVQYGTSDSASSQPTNWSATVPTAITKGKWLWVKTTYSDNTTAITKSYVGTDGEDGKSVAVQSATKTGGTTTVVLIDSDGNETTLTIDDGQDGDNGQPGANGYVHTAWANSADGQTDFSTSVSAGKKYLGVYTDNTAADSQTYSNYSWSLIKGADGEQGEKGEQGIQGPPGLNGQTSYLHIKYSDDGETFTLNPDTGERDGETLGAFIGMYTDFTVLDSMVFSDYEWHRFSDDTELKAYVDGKENYYNSIYLAQSTFGTYSQSIDQRMTNEFTSQHQFNEQISSDLLNYQKQVSGTIARGFIPEPGNPQNKILGIAIAQNLKIDATQKVTDSTGDYYKIEDETQNFGLYTASGWQFWINGQKAGWFDANGDGILHVRKVVAEDFFQISGKWQLKVMERGSELEFVYIGG